MSHYVSVSAMVVICLALIVGCDEKPQVAPEEPGWASLGFEDKLALRMKCAGDLLYVCAGPDGLWRKDLLNTRSEWQFLGLADSTFDDWCYGVQDVDVNDDDILVAYTSKDTEKDPGIWRSLDAGRTWTRSDSGVPAPEWPYSYMYSLARSPQRDSIGVAVNGATFTTTDGGATWTLLGPDRSIRTIELSVVWNAEEDGQVWIFGENCIFRAVLSRSQDWGATWQQLGFVREPPVPYEGSVYDLAFDPFESQTVYIGLYGLLAESRDGGDNWTVLLEQDERPVWEIACDPAVRGLIYLVVGASLYRSDDGARSVQPMATPNETLIESMIFHKRTHTLVIATPSGVFQLIEGGD